MAAAGLRDPLLRLYLALGVVLLPVVVLLAEAYPGYEERMRRAAGTPELEAIPADEVLQEQVVELVPDAAGCAWRLSYAPDEEPATGIARAYDLSEGPNLRYRFLVVRHDIACGVCRDLLVGLLYDAVRDQWAGFVALAPFERKAATMDPAAFLAQFVGKARGEEYVLGGNVDGITGATKSVKGFINRLREAEAWLQTERVALEQEAHP